MVAHDHATLVDGCFRCDLGRDEVAGMEVDQLREAARAVRIDAVNSSDRFLAAVSQWLEAEADCDLPADYDGTSDLGRHFALAAARAYLDED